MESAGSTAALLLLSCSNHKRSEGQKAYTEFGARRIVEYLTQSRSDELLGRRNEIRRLLAGGPPRLYNEDQKGGFRDERSCNQKIYEGPDFGGQDSGQPVYLPAYERYSGRFFSSVLSRAPSFWSSVPETIEVVLVSALYGLVLWDEPIQDYDCHFADYTNNNEHTVKQLWGNSLTEALSEFLTVRFKRGPSPRSTIVYDLLSEELYQAVFDWRRVKQIYKVKLFHRLFRGASGPDILTALAHAVTHDVDAFRSRYREGWYSLQEGKEDTLQFGFESEIGNDKTATREGDLQKVETLLAKEFPFFRELPIDVKRALVLAELSRRKVNLFSEFDWGGIVVSFTKPVERFCKVVLNLQGKETLGEVVAALEYPEYKKAWQPVFEQLKALNNMYVRGKHLTPPPIKRTELETVRNFAINILKHAERVRSRNDRNE